jgi:hypothetical protein
MSLLMQQEKGVLPDLLTIHGKFVTNTQYISLFLFLVYMIWSLKISVIEVINSNSLLSKHTANQIARQGNGTSLGK